jgi:surfactin synthase thioesterase subunit/NADP-dependent 3-hydroxy acid dehydrogenase YdfG/aryl carrier-like protein
VVEASALLRRALGTPAPAGTELVWVTRGAAGPARGIADAAVTALVRAAAHEHPERAVRTLDLPLELPPGAAARDLLARALALPGEPELAAGDDGILRAPRLVRAAASGEAASSRMTREREAAASGEAASSRMTREREALDPDGWVLITGGTGALGRALARHLVEVHGIRRLVLCARTRPDVGACAALAASLAAAEARRIVACDVTRRAELADLLGSLPAGQRWTAVFHLAGVLADGVLAKQTRAGVVAALDPKIRGALHLHELTRGLTLEAFVLYSSTSALLGAPGQSNYAAANAALDALAAHRIARGLPAASIAWGLWAPEAGGLGARLGDAARDQIRERGVVPITAADGGRWLDLALATGAANVAVMPLDEARVAARLRTGAPLPPLWSRLFSDEAAPAPAPGEPLAALAGLPAAARRGALTELVREEAAAVLAVRAAALADDTALPQAGLDSLMAITLRTRLAARTGLAVTPELVFRGATPSGIAARLADLLAPGGGAGDGAGEDLSGVRWLKVLKAAPRPRARVFCFPGMGGAASGYVPLAAQLPPDVELVGIQLPGREDRLGEPPIDDMDLVTEEIAAAMAPLLDRPAVLFGYSFGAWLTLETGRRLEARGGGAPIALVIATAHPPSAASTAKIDELAALLGERAAAARPIAPELIDEELIDALRGVLPDSLLGNHELLGGYLSACAADAALAERYRRAARGREQPALAVPVVALSASDDAIVTPAQMAGWRSATRGRFAQRSLDGSHAAPIEQPAATAAVILEALGGLPLREPS